MFLNPLTARLSNSYSAIATGRLFIMPNDMSQESLSEVVAATAPRPTLGMLCPPCGIRFSSANTLEAHQKFYCQHRPRLENEAGDNNGDDDDKSGNPGSNTAGKLERRAYACPHCSYSADKKVSLNRHMRMHAPSPVQPAAVMPPVVVTAAQQPTSQSQQQYIGATAGNGTLNEEAERYCQNCDIRFVLLFFISDPHFRPESSNELFGYHETNFLERDLRRLGWF